MTPAAPDRPGPTKLPLDGGEEWEVRDVQEIPRTLVAPTTSQPHVRRDRGTPSGAPMPPEPAAAHVRQDRPAAAPGPKVGANPDVDVRHDHREPEKAVPQFLRAPERLDVFQDANQGPVPVEAHAALKPKTRTRVMTTGVFDLIHLGHIQMLEAARRLGDELVVVIARDETVSRQKHVPINPEETRRRVVEALKPVSRAVLGQHGDIYRIVKELRPDVIALGHDQPFREEDVERRCAELGVKARVVRLPQFDEDLDATRKIIDRIGERIARKELYTRGPDPE